ncbi:hypothetical protein Salat_2545300 [Sesamum alatum]|uniref:Reverse transcriptase n=1 Tax=Sesamum alatum TaxID=300844 RepID=A0AAE2CCM7_9LAMI|nr:hypothetical protein Salat_2545300 [Sesamum alatum]
MECLQEFRDVSGLTVNTSKFSIFTAGIPLAAQRLTVTNYSLLVDRIAAAVVDKIHRLCRNFLWNSKRAPVAWEEICHPKEEGGLGIRHIQSWNVALLARVLWNVHRKADTLSVKWVNKVYLRGASVLDWQLKKGDSPLLRWLADIRDRLTIAFGASEAAVEHMGAWSNLKGLETSKAYE